MCRPCRKVWRRGSCWSRPAPSSDGRGGTSNSEAGRCTTPKTARYQGVRRPSSIHTPVCPFAWLRVDLMLSLSKLQSLIFDEVDLSDASVAETSTKNINNSFTVNQHHRLKQWFDATRFTERWHWLVWITNSSNSSSSTWTTKFIQFVSRYRLESYRQSLKYLISAHCIKYL